jgi:hypothetical protein
MHSKHAISAAEDALDALMIKYPPRPLMITWTEATTDPHPDSPAFGHHLRYTATATPPLHSQQRPPKPSIIPSDSYSQHSGTYLCECPESSM